MTRAVLHRRGPFDLRSRRRGRSVMGEEDMLRFDKRVARTAARTLVR